MTPLRFLFDSKKNTKLRELLQLQNDTTYRGFASDHGELGPKYTPKNPKNGYFLKSQYETSILLTLSSTWPIAYRGDLYRGVLWY